jgi:hypothetical protein
MDDDPADAPPAAADTPDPKPGGRPGGLHQMSMSFSAEEDRILFRLSTTDHVECRLWFTRRYTRLLWGALKQRFEQSGEAMLSDGPGGGVDPKVKDAMLAMQHHDAVSQGDFSKGFDESGENVPLADQPLLVIGGACKPQPDGRGTRLTFRTKEGKEIGVTLNEDLLHAFCHLLQQTASKGEWDLNMVLGGANVFIPDDGETVIH